MLISISGCNTRKSRGAGLISFLFAMPLLAVVVFWATKAVSEYNFERRQAEIAGDLRTIIAAAEANYQSSPKAFYRSLSIRGFIKYELSDLKSAENLVSSFPETNSLGQGYAVYFRDLGNENIEIMATTITPENHPLRYNNVSLREFTGGNAIGLVHARTPNKLTGPGIDADITPYRTRFGEPSVGETAVLSFLSKEQLNTAYLYRVNIDGSAELNSLATDLDLSGRNILNAGDINSQTLTLTNELTALGDVSVTGDLNVGRTLNVTGNTVITGGVNAHRATLSEDINANIANITRLVTTNTLDTGIIVANSGNFTGSLSAVHTQTERLFTSELNAQSITGDTATIKDIDANEVLARENISTETAHINNLNVGSCTGC